MFNENIGHDIETSVAFKSEGYVYRYDAFEDKLYKPSIITTGKQKKYKLLLHTYETVIWIVSKTQLDADIIEEGIDENTIGQLPLSKEWKVEFADSFQYPSYDKTVPIKELGLVSDLKHWENVCGTVRYTGTFTNIMDKTFKRAVLKIEESFETTQIFVNGNSAGVKLCGPYEYDITPWMKNGVNDVMIEVTNTLGTAFRDGLSQYLMIEPFGVRGNITLDLKG